MEQMSISEVIKQQQKFAHENRKRCMNGNNASSAWLERAERCDQIAAWLEELKRYREKDEEFKNNVIRERVKIIKSWIDECKNEEKIVQCLFYISTPHLCDGDESDFRTESEIVEVGKILDRNGIKWVPVDTILGDWNLNKVWIETEAMECMVEYCGVYPANWPYVDDIVRLEKMCNEGEIIIRVMVKKNGKWVDNH